MRCVGAMIVAVIALTNCSTSRQIVAQDNFSSPPPAYQTSRTPAPDMWGAQDSFVTCPDGSVAASPEICAMEINDADVRQPARRASPARDTRVASVQPPSQSAAAAAPPALASVALTKQPPAPNSEKPPAAIKREAEVLSVAAITALIVRESRNEYYATGHPCACPDDRTRNGRSCGNMSAYVRPGGAHPLCYAADVTAEMIQTRRQQMAEK